MALDYYGYDDDRYDDQQNPFYDEGSSFFEVPGEGFGVPVSPPAAQSPAPPVSFDNPGGGGGDKNTNTSQFTMPLRMLTGTGDWPTFSYPALEKPDPFTYADFAPPTLADAGNEPGFAFAMEQGQKALETAAAAKGLARTGGALKDLIGFGQKLGEQNYSNVYNRAKSTYDTNRGNAFDNYFGNWGVTRDAYGLNQKNAYDMWGSGQRNRELDFMREMDIYQSDLDLQKYLAGLGAP